MPFTSSRFLICLMSFLITALFQDNIRSSVVPESFSLKTNETRTISINDELTKNEEIYLSFSARVNTQGRYDSGSAASLIITVNKVPVNLDRLQNKRPFYYFNKINKVNWFYGNDGWAVSYYPWEDANKVAGGQVHKYVFDIKNLLRENNNQIHLKNRLTGVRNSYLEIRDLKILTSGKFERSPLLKKKMPASKSYGLENFRQMATGYHEGVNVSLNQSIDFKLSDVKNVKPREYFAQQYDLAIEENGKINIEINGEKYEITSFFRTPQKAWKTVGFDNGAANWTSIDIVDQKITCESRELQLTRTIIKKDSHIAISDQFTNKTGHDLPVVVFNAVDFKKLDDLVEFRIAGNKQPSFYCSTSTMDLRMTGDTPLVYLERKDSGIGVLIADDVYRNQATYMARDTTLGIGDDLFYLKPKASYTMVWKIFPTQAKDYYEVVNAVRADWGFSREIPGLFGFVHPFSENHGMYEDAKYKTPEDIKKFLDNTGLTVPSTLAVVTKPETGKPFGLTGNEPISYMRKGTESFSNWTQKAREAGCDIKALPYLDVHLVKPYFDKGVKNVDKRLPGSLIKDAYGEFVPYSTGEQYLVLPSMKTSCGKHLFEVLKIFLDEQGFDGLYLDEWDHSRSRVSFNHFDGYSALLDRNAKLVRKIGFVPLLTIEFQKAFCDEITKRGKLVYANQFDGTMSSAKLPIIHFAEPLGSYDYKLFAAQLTATPLSLHVARTTSLWKDVKEFLKRGVLTCYYFKYFHGDHVLKKCFPITVKEVWPGYVIGEKKIVTMLPGSYGFDRTTNLTAYIYSGEKALLEKTESSVTGPNGKQQITLPLNGDQVAVIVEQQDK